MPAASNRCQGRSSCWHETATCASMGARGARSAEPRLGVCWCAQAWRTACACAARGGMQLRVEEGHLEAVNAVVAQMLLGQRIQLHLSAHAGHVRA